MDQGEVFSVEIGEVFVPLYEAWLMVSPEYCVWFWSFMLWKNVFHLEKVGRRTSNLLTRRRLEELGTFGLAKKGERDKTVPFKYFGERKELFRPKEMWAQAQLSGNEKEGF